MEITGNSGSNWVSKWHYLIPFAVSIAKRHFAAALAYTRDGEPELFAPARTPCHSQSGARQSA